MDDVRTRHKAAISNEKSSPAPPGAQRRDHLVCVIQARLTSSRLPEKILMPLGGREVLAHVIRRARAIPSVSRVVVAVPDTPKSDKITAIADRESVDWFKGSETDVLSRFYGATRSACADYVMRITSDCPLLSSAVCETMFNRMLDTGVDYAVTTSWPHGLDCEIFTGAALERAHRAATLAEDREHVTLWMKANTALKKLLHAPEAGQFKNNYRWVLDYPKDYEFLSRLFAMTDGTDILEDCVRTAEFVDAHPDLWSINRECAAEWGKANRRLKDMVHNRDTQGDEAQPGEGPAD